MNTENRVIRKNPPLGSRTWTREEKLYLEEHWGYISIPTIAQQLNRTIEAVKLKASRLHLGPALLGGDYITLNQLIKTVTGNSQSYSYHMISWVKNRGFPVHTKKINKNSFRVVYIDEFWEWAKKNKSFIDFSKMEPLALGVEPEWVAEQRRKDYKAYSLQRKDPWSAADDSKLLYLLKQQKYGYKELSEMLCRSAGAIQRRCTDLGTKYRPVKADTHGASAEWSDKDYAILAKGIKDGDSYTVIGNLIGKSEKAVRGKVYTVYLTENADKVRSMLQNGEWSYGAPVPTVKQAKNLSGQAAAVKKRFIGFVGCAEIPYERIRIRTLLATLYVQSLGRFSRLHCRLYRL